MKKPIDIVTIAALGVVCAVSAAFWVFGAEQHPEVASVAEFVIQEAGYTNVNCEYGNEGPTFTTDPSYYIIANCDIDGNGATLIWFLHGDDFRPQLEWDSDT